MNGSQKDRSLSRLRERAETLGAVFATREDDVPPPASAAWDAARSLRDLHSLTRVGECDGPIRAAGVLDAEGGATIVAVATDQIINPAAWPGVIMGEDEADRVLSALEQCWNDELELGEFESESLVFTRELDEAYETIATMYHLGARVHAFADPHRFCMDALDRLRGTLGNVWAAVLIDEDESVLESIRGRCWLSGIGGSGASQIEQALRSCAGELEQLTRAGVVNAPQHPRLHDSILSPLQAESGTIGWMVLSGHRDSETVGRGITTSADTQAAGAVASLIMGVLESHRLYCEQQSTFTGTLTALTGSLDAKDRYTSGHSERVALLGQQLALATGMSQGEAARIELAGRLHDIGKIGVPDRVLCKPSRLDDEEFELIKQHPGIGHDILAPIPVLRDILPGVLHHHERWDGRGYPSGLSGEDIALQARILALADAFDAMSSDRAYRSSRPREAVIAEIEKGAGSQFDPDLAAHFVKLDFSAFDLLKSRHAALGSSEQRKEKAA